MQHDWVDLEVPSRLPVIPLVSSVLFPGGVLSLQVGIDRNVRLLKSLPDDQNLIAAFCQKTGDKENPRAEDLAPVGVLAAIVQRLPLSADRYQLFLQGRQRVELVQMLQNEPYFEAQLRELAPKPISKGVKTDQLMNKAMSLFEKLVESDSKYSNELLNILRMNMAEGPDTFADLLSSFVNFPLEEKQLLLETVNPIERIELLIDYIQRDLGRATVDRELQRQIQTSIDRRDRENYLREQMRIIQDELGETNAAEREADTYRDRIEALPVADEHKQSLRREVTRMGQLSQSSSDYAVIKGHLDTVLQVPWSAQTEDRLDLKKAEEILEQRHHGLEKVKERVLEFLAVLKLKGDLKGPILCFVGPPGVGKTSLGSAIADSLGRKFVRMAVGGVTDESEIRGHRKTYIGAMPGKLINSYIQVGVNNPLVMIDEIDKIGKDFRGDPASALLEVLDPKQNHAFVDRYLEIPYDLSHTLFICTANVLDMIPSPLRDRMEVIRLSGYTENEKLAIANKHLIPELLENHGLGAEQVTIENDAISAIVRDYTAESGVRNLERNLATVLRKIARKVASDDAVATQTYEVKKEDIETYLGLAKFEHEFAERHPEIGVTTGLAWTQFGGEIMFIEATRMPGSGRTTVTGQLGDVMRESVTAAYSYVRSRAHDLGIDDRKFTEQDIHIHFPAGAIPKDGPSAGVAIATCIASVMGERPVRHDVAMSGEITLRGKVLSVGGIKEKVMAAHRANITTIVLPEGNRKDLQEVPEETKGAVRFVFAERVEDVWKEALIPLYVVKDHDRKYDDREFIADQQKEERSGPTGDEAVQHMRRGGCLGSLLFGALLLLAFGGSSYFWFTYFVKGRSLPTPNLIGKSVAQARAITADLGVDLVVDEEHRRNADNVPVGHIVWQNRSPGATSFIKRGSTLKVELSAGPLVIRVPDLTGSTGGTGMLRLGQQNLKPGPLAYVGTVATGILGADPPKETVVPPQTAVSLLVAVPPLPPQYVMPDLIDRPLDQVRPSLEARGLTVSTVKFEAYPGIADGIIIRQYPLRGAPVSSRDPISVVVSRQEETSIIEGPPPAPVINQ